MCARSRLMQSSKASPSRSNSTLLSVAWGFFFFSTLSSINPTSHTNSLLLLRRTAQIFIYQDLQRELRTQNIDCNCPAAAKPDRRMKTESNLAMRYLYGGGNDISSGEPPIISASGVSFFRISTDDPERKVVLNETESSNTTYQRKHIRFCCEHNYSDITETTEFQSRLISAYHFDSENQIPNVSENIPRPSLRKKRRRDPAKISRWEWRGLHDPVVDEWISLINRTARTAPAAAARRPRAPTAATRGNYSNYYWRRSGGGALLSTAPGVWNDGRLAVLRPEWFAGRRCLDVGCNAGLLTMSIAYKFRSPPTPRRPASRAAVAGAAGCHEQGKRGRERRCEKGGRV